MYTDVEWTNDLKWHSGKGNSFVFSYHKGTFKKYEHKGYGEVYHSGDEVFVMAGNGPKAIRNDHKTSYAELSKWFIADKGTDRRTALCGERFPELAEVEVYQLK